ncbi:MAG: PAS domain-containing protein [Methylococcaceae bacterium]
MSYKTHPRYLHLKEQLQERMAEKMITKFDDTLENYHFDELTLELEVHRIELEIQNENLRLAEEELEKSRTRYAMLYDIAPVSYITLNIEGFITEINFASLFLFGVERDELMAKSFADFVATESVESWNNYFTEIKENTSKKQCNLILKRADNVLFPAHLHGIFSESYKQTASCVRLAIIDISVD